MCKIVSLIISSLAVRAVVGVVMPIPDWDGTMKAQYRSIGIDEDEDLFNKRPFDGKFSKKSHIARLEVARQLFAMASETVEVNFDIWDRLEGNTFVARAVASGREDFIKAAALLVGDFAAMGIEMPGFDPKPLCDAIKDEYILPDFEYDFIRKAMDRSSVGRIKVLFFTPFANFDRIECNKPFSLEFSAKMMREQILRAMAVQSIYLAEKHPFEIIQATSVARYSDMVAVLTNTNPRDLVTKFSVSYTDTLATGVTPTRDYIARFLKQIRRVPSGGTYKLVRTYNLENPAMYEPELRAIGRALGLSIIYNIPIGFALDAELLTYLVAKQPEVYSQGTLVEESSDIARIKAGFKDIVPQTNFEISRYMSYKGLGALFLGTRVSLIAEQVRDNMILFEKPVMSETDARLLVEPIYELSAAQQEAMSILFEYLETSHKLEDFVRKVTGQHNMPLGSIHACPPIHVVFGTNRYPTINMTYNMLLLPEATESLRAQLEQLLTGA